MVDARSTSNTSLPIFANERATAKPLEFHGVVVEKSKTNQEV
jgi:hypothetical protein